MPSVLVHLSDVLAIPVSPVQKLPAASTLSTSTLDGYPVYNYKPDLIRGPEPESELRSPMAYVTNSAQVNIGTPEERNDIMLRRGQYLSDDTVFVGAVQIIASPLNTRVSTREYSS